MGKNMHLLVGRKSEIQMSLNTNMSIVCTLSSIHTVLKTLCKLHLDYFLSLWRKCLSTFWSKSRTIVSDETFTASSALLHCLLCHFICLQAAWSYQLPLLCVLQLHSWSFPICFPCILLSKVFLPSFPTFAWPSCLGLNSSFSASPESFSLLPPAEIFVHTLVIACQNWRLLYCLTLLTPFRIPSKRSLEPDSIHGIGFVFFQNSDVKLLNS